MSKSFLLKLGSGLVVGLLVGVIVLAFNNPTGNPTTGDGIIGVGSGAPASSLYINSTGNVGIGTTAAPGAKLEVAGQIKITGGVPGVNKVLTSDAAGLASWQAPSSPGVTLPSGAVFMMITGSCPAGTTDASATYANKFLRINATQGTTGGSDTLSIAEANLPSHTHPVTVYSGAGSGAQQWPTNVEGDGNVSDYSVTFNSGSTGSGAAATITNPYVTAKMCQVN